MAVRKQFGRRKINISNHMGTGNRANDNNDQFMYSAVSLLPYRASHQKKKEMIDKTIKEKSPPKRKNSSARLLIGGL